MHAADAMVAAVPEVRAADLAIRSDIKNQKVSAARKLAEQPRSLGGKEVCRATKKSRCQGSWPSNQEVSVSRKLSEQSRSLGVKEVGRAIKKSRRKGIWPTNQGVMAARFGRAIKKSRLQGIWPSNQSVFGPWKESSDHEKSLRTTKRVSWPS